MMMLNVSWSASYCKKCDLKMAPVEDMHYFLKKFIEFTMSGSKYILNDSIAVNKDIIFFSDIQLSIIEGDMQNWLQGYT